MPTDLRKARELFLHAVGKLPSEQWEGYVAEACGGDADLAQQVGCLLQVHREAGSFLDAPAPGLEHPETSTALYPDLSEGPGTVIGPYKLLQQIGEGGMGVVFMAEQSQPLQRTVALKIIKPGMDTRQVITRFEAERQAVAMMDHPNIAKVLDAGTTDSGRPYFAMELVKGIPITKYCDDKHLPLRARLELFMQVCQAVQHAHQKGIIHRDIKPNNVLVAEYDNHAVPKVIDFGVAKATAQKLTEQTMFTEFGQVLGTMEYMSPEQAKLNQLDIDTRSDIYSLGVLLYELLAGSTPFERKRLKEAALDEMLRIIREEEPPKPSTRVSSIDTLPSVAVNRDTESARLSKEVRGDLDWIVMKCLEKDRSRRYETANGLAADLKRHLENEPVVARPPSTAYKFQKAWKRNKAAFVAGVTVMLALVLGGAGSTWQAILAGRARNAEAEERIKADLASKRAIASAQSAESQRQNAEAATRRAERQEQAMRRRAYAADMNVAHQAVRINNLGRARELLNRYASEPGKEDLRGWEWRYLWGLSQSDAMLQLCRLPESDAVMSTAIRPEVNWVAIGGAQGSGVEVWDLSARSRLAQLASGEQFAHVAFSPDGTRLAFSTTEWLRVWNCATREMTAEAPLDHAIVSLSFSADGQSIITFQPNTAIRQWRASDLQMLDSTALPEGHAVLGSPFAVSTDLKTAVHVEGFGGIVVINLESGEERWRYKSPAGNAHAMAISPDGGRLATSFGLIDGTIQIWDLATGDLVKQLAGHRAWVSTLKFWPDGKTLVSASADQTIRMWDLELFEPTRILQGHTLEVWSLDLSPDGKTLVSGSKNGEVLVWDAKRDQQKLAAWTVPGHHWSWQFSSDSEAIHAVERDSRRFLRYQGPTFARGDVLPELQFDFQWAEGFNFSFSPSGRLFAATTTNGVLRVWNLDERKLSYEFAVGSIASGRPLPVAFSADETRVWLHHRDPHDAEKSILTEWDLKGEQSLRSMKGLGKLEYRLHLHPDKWAAWESGDGSVAFHDLRTGRTSRPGIATGRLHELRCLSSSPDGELLVLGHDLGVLTVWETASLDAAPRQVKTLGGILMSFHSAAFFADGTRLLAGSHGAEAIKIWETQSYNEVLTLEGDGTSFYRIQLAADGSVLGALNEQGKLHLWHAPTWEEINALEVEVGARPTKAGLIEE